MVIEKLIDPSLAQEMSDVNHAAFGYKQLKDLTRYQVQRRLKSKQYEAYGMINEAHVVGFVFINHNPNDFILAPDEKCIENFSLLPWLHRKGLGKALLNYVINEIYPKNSFHLTVNAHNKAVFLYNKLGFISYGTDFLVRGNIYIAMLLLRNENTWKQT